MIDMKTFSTPDIYPIESIAFLGRTFDEYLRFFDLHDNVLASQSTLDVSAGPSSFAAEASHRNFQVTACDPLYDRTASALGRVGSMDVESVLSKAAEQKQHFRFSHYSSMEEVYRLRYEALRRFSEDYPIGRALGRYVCASLPELPFSDGSYDLVLNAHFLFLYGNRFDPSFIRQSLSELLRVSREEVLIYPLVQLNGERYPVESLREYFASQGARMTVKSLDFEFFSGSNEFLSLTKL